MLEPDHLRGTLIGDDVRDKWNEFLGKAFQLGYLTLDEYQQRSAIVLAARTVEEIKPVLRDFSKTYIDAWSADWKSPQVKIAVKPAPVPVKPQPLFVRSVPVIMTILVAIVIVLGVCIELAR